MVFSEVRRRQLAQSGGWDLSFWRDRSKEADFLFHRGGRFLLADAKWTEHPDRRDASALLRVASELETSLVDRLGLICRAANPYPVVAQVEAMPLAGIDRLTA